MSRPSLVLVPQYFGALLFDRHGSRYLPFDRVAARILSAMTERPAGDVIAASHPDDRGAVEGLARHLARCGFLRLDGTLAAARIDREPPAECLLGPLAVHLEVVAACNLRCAHCFAGDLPRGGRPLSLAEMDRLFAELAGLGSFRLGVTGGEPLLRRDLLEILDAATAHGLHPCVTTNGLLLDEPIARELGRRNLVWLNVSLDGATAATNDAIRGQGVFARVLERLAVLRRHARFTLAFTLTRGSLDEVEACASLARAVGAETAVFRPLYPVGKACRAPGLMPTLDEYVASLSRLEHLAGCGELFVSDAFSPASREEHRGIVMPGPACGAATRVASISVDGAVSPCSFLGAELEAGNVRSTSFEDIWRAGTTFRRLRRPEPGDRFAGGCRARAQYHSGSVFAEDPWQARHDELSGRGRASPEPARVAEGTCR